MQTLQDLYVKPTNEMYARHLLATRRQHPNETLGYLQALKSLSKDYNYKNVTVSHGGYYRISFRVYSSKAAG